MLSCDGTMCQTSKGVRIDFSASVKHRSGLADSTYLDCVRTVSSLQHFHFEVMGDREIDSFRNGEPAVFCESLPKMLCRKSFSASVRKHASSCVLCGGNPSPSS